MLFSRFSVYCASAVPKKTAPMPSAAKGATLADRFSVKANSAANFMSKTKSSNEVLNKLRFWATLVEKTDGRDKLTKVVQNSTRLSRNFLTANTPLARRVKQIQDSASVARKVFSLGNFASDVVKVHNFVSAPIPSSPADRKLFSLEVISRLGFLGAATCDSINNASSVGLLKPLNSQKWVRKSASFWTVGLVSGFIAESDKLRRTQADLLATKTKSYQATQTPEQKTAVTSKLKSLETKETGHYENMIKGSGDLVQAIQGTGLPRMLLGLDIPEPMCAMGVLVSSSLGLRQTLRNVKTTVKK